MRNSSNAKKIAVAALWGLLVQYPIALAYTLPPVIAAEVSVPALVEFLAFYGLSITVVATAVILLLGLPAFLWLRTRYSPSIRGMAVLGGTIAASLAVLARLMFFPGPGYSSGENYYGTYRDMIVDGVPTIWGWISFVEDTLLFTIHGALGAVFFFLGWRRCEAQESFGTK